MRAFGWAVTVVVGGYATFLLIKSLPDIYRYMKLQAM
jgi:hypothetical protein